MLKKLKMKKRLLLSFLVVDLLMLITTLIGLTGLKFALLNLNNLTQGVIPVDTSVLSCRIYSNTAAAKLSEMILAQDPASYDSDAAILDEILGDLDQTLDFLDSIYSNGDAGRENLDEYISLMDEWKNISNRVLDNLKQQKYTEAQALLNESIPTRQEMVAVADRMTQNVELARDQTVNSSRSQTIQYSYLLLALLVAATVVSIVLTFRLTYSIVKPLRQVQNAADEMARGNLKIQIDYEARDELGELANSMRTMSERTAYYMGEITSAMEQLAAGDLDVKRREAFLGDFLPAQEAVHSMVVSLNTTMHRINQSADLVANGSEQVSSGAQALSQGASQQAASVEQLVATMNEITHKASGNSESAQLARDTVDKVGAELLESNQQMQEMIKAMGEISASSNEIRKVIKTIEDIAFQTNILALNAAVEAARAGAAGKGFAVVASEVKNLASKSSEASKGTSSLITHSLKSVENGSKIANETASSLLAVVDGTKEVTSQINRIAEASKEQAQAAAQVTQGIEQISNVVQTNSATAEESAASSEELSGQAQVLKGLVRKFRLSSTDMPFPRLSSVSEARIISAAP